MIGWRPAAKRVAFDFAAREKNDRCRHPQATGRRPAVVWPAGCKGVLT